MLFKKDQAKQENSYTAEYKRLWDEATNAMKKLRSQVYNVEGALGAITLYPYGYERDEAKEHAEEMKKQLIILMDEYHKAIVKVEHYYTLYSKDIELVWYPNRWEHASKIIEDTYRTIHHLWERA